MLSFWLICEHFGFKNTLHLIEVNYIWVLHVYVIHLVVDVPVFCNNLIPCFISDIDFLTLIDFIIHFLLENTSINHFKAFVHSFAPFDVETRGIAAWDNTMLSTNLTLSGWNHWRTAELWESPCSFSFLLIHNLAHTFVVRKKWHTRASPNTILAFGVVWWIGVMLHFVLVELPIVCMDCCVHWL